MKKSLLILIDILLMITLFSDSWIVQAKRDYILNIDNVEITTPKGPYDEFIKIHTLRMVRLNTTSRALNISFTTLIDMPSDAVWNLAAYERMPSKRYSMMPVNYPTAPLCKFIDEDKIIYGVAKKDGFLPQKCPVTKGNYWLYNFDPNTVNLPDKMPGEYWRGDIKIQSKGNTIFSCSIFTHLDRNAAF